MYRVAQGTISVGSKHFGAPWISFFLKVSFIEKINFILTIGGKPQFFLVARPLREGGGAAGPLRKKICFETYF